jgi:hypothetical protein
VTVEGEGEAGLAGPNGELGCGNEGGSWRPGGETKEHWRTSADGLSPKEFIGFYYYYYYFLNLIFNAKTFPGNPRKCFKARKILRKFQKFQENSRRHIGT